MDLRDIENRFTYHPPEPENDQPARYGRIRAEAKKLALLVDELADDSREKSLAGIPQSLPPEKMASAGADWKTNPVTQMRWGLKYIKERYGSPAGACENGTG